MGTITGVVVGTIVLVIVSFLPSFLFTIIGWKISRRIQNDRLRIIIRSGVLSIAFTPTIYGHAGIVFASWMIFLGNGLDRIIYGLIPILIAWTIIGTFALRRRKGSNKTKGSSLDIGQQKEGGQVWTLDNRR